MLQYVCLTEEVDEIKAKIKKLEEEILDLQDKIREIENDYIVKDKVYGGNGGKQGFVIRGVSKKRMKECEMKKVKLLKERILVEEHKKILEEREIMVKRQINEIETFISSISDTVVRRIIDLRIVQRLSWNEVADKIGGGNTDYSVKKMYYRYLEHNVTNVTQKCVIN